MFGRNDSTDMHLCNSYFSFIVHVYCSLEHTVSSKRKHHFFLLQPGIPLNTCRGGNSTCKLEKDIVYYKGLSANLFLDQVFINAAEASSSYTFKGQKIICFLLHQGGGSWSSLKLSHKGVQLCWAWNPWAWDSHLPVSKSQVQVSGCLGLLISPVKTSSGVLSRTQGPLPEKVSEIVFVPMKVLVSKTWQLSMKQAPNQL